FFQKLIYSLEIYLIIRYIKFNSKPYPRKSKPSRQSPNGNASISAWLVACGNKREFRNKIGRELLWEKLKNGLRKMRW
ncbi:hypothetical protein, partial [Muricomes intestini]|uniref:hypothetical protein n=1 Tax=Muricomes intestini TaxID=1796634 RepID=UPI002FE26E74